jgi:hypothetical protein
MTRAADSDAQAVQVQQITYKGWTGAWRMSNGVVEVVVVPQVGRVMHYGLVGGSNVLWENAELAGKTSESPSNDWQNYGGDKIWPWPQDEWEKRLGRTWPPVFALDQLAHKGERLEGGVIRLTSPVAAEYGVRLVRQIRLAAEGTQLTVTSDLVPEPGAESVPGWVWEIAQVPRPRIMLARLLPGSTVEQATGLMIKDAPWRTIRQIAPRIVQLQPPNDRAAKVGMEADLIAGLVGDNLFVQRALLDDGQYAPNERAQLYTEPDDAAKPGRPAYVEFEFTASRTPEVDGTSRPLVTVWEIRSVPPDATPEDLAKHLLALGEP